MFTDDLLEMKKRSVKAGNLVFALCLYVYSIVFNSLFTRHLWCLIVDVRFSFSKIFLLKQCSTIRNQQLPFSFQNIYIKIGLKCEI